MRVSVLLVPADQPERLRRTLEALRRQDYEPFEVLLPHPAGAEPVGVPHALRGAVRAIPCDGGGWASLHNRGAAASAGELLAGLAAGAVPHRGWLAELAGALGDGAAAGAGGVVLDAPGAPGHPRWAVCDRLGQRGEEDFPPPDAYFRPGADPFADLPPCNWAFRRDRFAALGGLDEALETDLALAELCARAADAGLPVRAAVGARVYRGADNAAGADPAVALRDAALFAARGARRTGRVGEVLRHFSALASGPRVPGAGEEAARLRERLHAAVGAGVEQGLAGERRGREVPPPDPGAFRPFPLLRPEGARRTFCLVAPARDGRPAGTSAGVADLLPAAEAAAGRGHEVHVLAPAVAGEAAEWVNGVWVHRVAAASGYAAAVHGALARLRGEGGVDLLAAPGGDAPDVARLYDPSGAAEWGEAPLREAAEVFARRCEEVAAAEEARDGFLALAPELRGARLNVSLVSTVVAPHDATANFCRLQLDVIDRFARAGGTSVGLRLYALRSEIDDPRVVEVPDAAALALDPHFAASDLIVYTFGFYNPLFDTIHLAPRSARLVVCYLGITPVGLVPPGQREGVRRSYRQLPYLHQADRVLVKSGYLARELEALGVAPPKVARIPFAHALPGSEPAPPRGLSPGRLRIAYVGRFVRAKGVLDLFEAVRRLRDRRPGLAAEVDLFGGRQFSDPGYLEELHGFAARNRLADRVRFHFDLPAAGLAEGLRAADVLVMPSYHEGFCVPVLEALASGCPVVCTDAGAIPETSGGLGLSYPSGDSAALAAALDRFLEVRARGAVPTDRGEMGEAEWCEAAAAHLKRFTPEAFAEQFCRAVFDGLRPPPRDLSPALADAHRRALAEVNARPAPEARPRRRGGLFDHLGETPAPCRPGPEAAAAGGSVRERLGGLLRRARARVARLPLIGTACRYLKRLVALPWNFHLFYQEFRRGWPQRPAG